MIKTPRDKDLETIFQLQQEITDQKRQLDDKAKLIKSTDKANSAMSLEISELKTKNDNLVLSVASLNSQAVLQVGLHNKVVVENEELKSALHLAVTKPMQPLINHRFKENKIVSYCLDFGGTDLNRIAVMDFSVDDREQFAQLIGYSLSGYGDLSYVTDETYERAEKNDGH